MEQIVEVTFGSQRYFHYAEYPDSPNTFLNRIYICPCCGEVWARIRFNNVVNWRPVTRSCDQHSYFESERRGSLFENWREDIWLFPPEVIKREVLFALGLLPCKILFK